MKAEIVTSEGNITLELDADKAPLSVKNFVQYAEADFYNDTIFHRVIEGFMIQGGGMTEDMERKETNAPIKNESGNGLKNQRLSIAMARTNDPDSATSQFYINLVDNPLLDSSRYAVFGRVVDGEEVVDKIAQVKTHSVGAYRDVPVETVRIESVKISD